MARIMTIGSSYASGDNIISPYSDGGFAPATADYSFDGVIVHNTHTFTNTSGTTRAVREVRFNDGYINYPRIIFEENAMQNFCNVPNGGTVSIDYYWYNSNPPLTGIAFASGTIDTSEFTNSAEIHYNGVALRNGLISKINPAYGALGWDVECFTLDYADITAINAFAGPISTGTSITGKQYVVSAFRAGTLKIKNPITNAYVSYNNCYILAPIDVTPFGDGYNYTVKVIQSAYSEA